VDFLLYLGLLPGVGVLHELLGDAFRTATPATAQQQEAGTASGQQPHDAATDQQVPPVRPAATAATARRGRVAPAATPAPTSPATRLVSFPTFPRSIGLATASSALGWSPFAPFAGRVTSPVRGPSCGIPPSFAIAWWFLPAATPSALVPGRIVTLLARPPFLRTGTARLAAAPKGGTTVGTELGFGAHFRTTVGTVCHAYT
jgi:hypothetical protein